MNKTIHNRWLWMATVAVTLTACSPGRADEGDDSKIDPTVNQALPVNSLLGAINGKPLFVEDVFRPIDADLRRIARVSGSRHEFEVQAHDAIQKQIKQQIGDLLIIKAAEDNMDEDDKKRIEMFMNKTKNDILTKNGGSIALTDEYYRSRGSSFERELSDIHRRATVELYLQRSLYPRITITRKMVLDYYAAHIKEYTSDPKVDLYTITIPFARYLPKENVGTDSDNKPIERSIANPSKEQLATAKNQALEWTKTLIQQIKAAPASEFPKFAEDNSVDPKQHSGGRWKETRRGDLLSKQVEDVAFSLAPHTIGPPLVINEDSPTDGAVMIIKVEDVDLGHVVPFTEAQKQIESTMREKQYAALSRDYYNKLFEKAAIEAVESMLDTATNVAVTRYFTR